MNIKNCGSRKIYTVCIAVLVLAMMLLPSVAVFAAAEVADVDTVLNGIVDFKLADTESASVSEWISGDLADEAGHTSEWYAIALAQSGGEYDLSAYASALRTFADTEEGKSSAASTYERFALALLAVGARDDAFLTAALDSSAGKQGIMSVVFALHLANNGVFSGTHTPEALVAELLSRRLEDGGWAVSGESSDVDVTAMTLQALAPYYPENGAVSGAVSEVLTLLSERQLDSGGFAAFGAENPESTAQVIIALSSLGIDACGESFIKNSVTLYDSLLAYRLENGAFAHVKGGPANHTATSQAFCALVAMRRQCAGKTPFYIFTDEEKPDAPAPDDVGDTDDAGDTADGESDNASAQPPDGDKSEFPVKPVTSAAVLTAALAVCALLFLKKKLVAKNLLFVIAVAAVAVAVIFFVDVRSADEYYGAENKTETVGSVKMTIRCDTVAGMKDYIPADGVILPLTEIGIEEGDTAYNVLEDAAREYRIHMDKKGAEPMIYMAGINYIYELDFGDLSGWIYRVNGETQSVGCGECVLHDGDLVEWLYTLDLGNDLG